MRPCVVLFGLVSMCVRVSVLHTFAYCYTTTYIFFRFFLECVLTRTHTHTAIRLVRIVCTLLWTVYDIYLYRVAHCSSLLPHIHTFLSFIFNRLYLLLRCSIPEYRSHSDDIYYCAPNGTVRNVHGKQHCT